MRKNTMRKNRINLGKFRVNDFHGKNNEKMKYSDFIQDVIYIRIKCNTQKQHM